jgi:hypothetical protein
MRAMTATAAGSSGRATRARSIATWTAVALTLAFAATRVGVAIADPEAGSAADPFGGGLPMAAFEALVLAMFAALGAVVIRKRPANAVGWILCVIPVSLGALLVSSHLYESFAAHHPDALVTELMAWLASWVWIPFVVPALTLFPLLFPTGRLLTPRWRWVVVVVALSFVMLFIGVAFEPGRLEDYPLVENPLGASGSFEAPVRVVGSLGFALMLVATLASAVSLVVRFRRAHGEERQQLKWVTTAAALFVVIFSVPEQVVGEEGGFALLLLGLLVVELAVAIAMLRYRLYDIDVVINRALVYGSLTASLAVVYVGSVLLLQLALSGLTEGSGLAVATSTLAVAALFRPVRGRIQKLVDRRFFRSRYDAARTVEAFGARLRDEVDLTALSADLQAVVRDTMRPEHVSLWLRSSDAAT